jgi:ABC-type lipoprotein release transport system permease subunit
MTLVGMGIAAGLIGAFFATDQLSKQLYGISATDPLTFVVVPLLVAAIALAASYLPSRLAARIEPHQALTSD